jgi:acetyltransferase-like isoleucine patch superfamily enzyme
MTLLRRLFAGVRLLSYRLRSFAIRTYLHLAYPGVRCHRSVIFGKGVSVRAFDGARLEIGEGAVVLEYAQVQADAGGHLVIGKGCLVGRGAVIICTESIEIGDGTLIAEHVTIRDQDHRHGGAGRLESKGRDSAAIRIGHDVWLGAKVTVTRGVEIAPHAVVGANSVVTRSLPDRAVYVGAPARPIRKPSN